MYCNETIDFVRFYCIVIVMVHSIVLLLIFGGVVPCCICTPIVRGKYTELFRGYDLKQRIAYRIGQVECLMSLLQEDNALLGLGSLHRGNYSRDVSRFALKQRIAFLLGQLNCLKIHISLEPKPEPRFAPHILNDWFLQLHLY